MQPLIPFNFRTSVVDSSKTNGKFVVNALDSKTNEIIGSVVAEPCLKKSYAGECFKPGYVDLSSGNSGRALPHMYINDLFVSPQIRRNGVGRTLIKEVVKESAKRGYEGRVILVAGNSYEMSPLPFYKKIGFISNKPTLNHKLDEFIKNKFVFFDNKVQSIMVLPKKVIKTLIQSR